MIETLKFEEKKLKKNKLEQLRKNHLTFEVN